jgi:hypothetical protein
MGPGGQVRGAQAGVKDCLRPILSYSWSMIVSENRYPPRIKSEVKSGASFSGSCSTYFPFLAISSSTGCHICCCLWTKAVASPADIGTA